MPAVSSHATCAVCARPVAIGSGYVVRIDVLADPQLPEMSSDEIADGNLSAAIAAVIEEAKNLSADDLQDGVHRRFEFRLCPTCQRRFLANPLGLPRETRIGNN
jgi:hypothetical protein